MKRWLGFFLALLVGAAIGLAYGWVINPVRFTDTEPQSLRSDYKTDLILMVAEAYQGDKDPALAAHRLTSLGLAFPQGVTPLKLVQQTILSAQKDGYPRSDLANLASLANALQSAAPADYEATP
jgi:hypothetical protein